MKKRIFAVAVAAAMVLSLAMFASCNGNGDDETEQDLGERMEISVTVRAVAHGNTLFEEEVTLEDYEPNLTVIRATIAAGEVAGVPIGLGAGDALESIGAFSNLGFGEVIAPDDDEYYENGYAEAGENGYEAPDYFWTFTRNGADAPANATMQRVQNGDVIQWNFEEMYWD